MRCLPHPLVFASLVCMLVAASGPITAQSDPASLYRHNCAGCHGSDRQGTGLGPPLSPQAYRYGGTRADLARIIGRGIASQGMPAFGGTLTSGQIDALATFLPACEAAAQQQEDAQPAATQRVSDPVPGLTDTLDYAVRAEVFVDGLQTVWAMAFLDLDTALVVERTGRLRLVHNGVLDPRPIAGTPAVHVSSHRWNQGGLLDIALDPGYADNGWIYLSYSHPLDGVGEDTRAMTRVVRGRVRDHAWVDEQVVFEADAAAYDNTAWHYGGRMVIDDAGALLVPLGDRGTMERARNPSDPAGKMHRVQGDGGAPAGHAFPALPGALPTLYSLGHRNPQGMAIEPDSGRIWATEHGPRGGDELNIIRAGADYGWPVVTYGINYDGTVLTPHTRAGGIEQPVYYWRPSIGVSGLALYRGAEFPLWDGKLLVTALGRRELRLLTLDGERVLHEEVVFRSAGRPYEPVVGPDGAIYLLTDDPGQILRLTAAAERRQ